MTRVYLSPPDIGELEEEYLLRAIRSGWVAPLGPDVDAFEAEMAERIGVENAVAVSSGTAAIHLALLGLRVGAGDTVVTSTMSFVATANAISYTGATPFFIDSDPVTGNMDPALLREGLDQLRRAGTPVAAALPIDLLGKAADYTAISQICAEFEVPLVADAAESLGATHAGVPAGAWGHAAVFSFNGNKVMTTSGGGMLLTSDSDLAARARHLATQAREPALHYEHRETGYNYRMSNLLAAVGRGQLRRLEAMIGRRRELRTSYREVVDRLVGVEVFGGPDDSDDNCWLTCILIDPEQAGWTAADLIAALAAADIESRPLWKPMHLQPLFNGSPGVISGAAESQFLRGVTLPSGSALPAADAERVRTILASMGGGSR